MSQPSRLRQLYSRNFLAGDLALSIGVSILVIVLFLVAIPTISLAVSIRIQLYSTGAVIAATLAGFALLAVAIILDASHSSALEVVSKSKHFPSVYDTLLSSVRYLGLTAVVLILALIAIGRSVEVVLLILVVWLALISALRIARTLWILSNVLSLLARTRFSEH